VFFLKYGVENISQLPEVINKKKETNFKKYGVTHPNKTKEIKDKISKSHKEILKNDRDKIVEKAKKTRIEKYGVDNVNQLQSTKDKIRKTTLERHGKEYYIHVKENQDRMRAKRAETWKNNKKEIKEKLKQTSLKKYNTEHPMQNEEVKKKVLAGLIRCGYAKSYDGIMAKELAENLDISPSYMRFLLRKYGSEIIKSYSKKYSTIEIEISFILEELGVKFTRQSTLCGRKTDLVIDESNLVIEADGLFWHSDARIKDNKYHLTKKNDYKACGYESLFFRQDEIYFKREIVKSIISNKLKLNKVKYFARKTYIEEVKDQRIINTWFLENHLMGGGQGKVFGLFSKDTKELLSAIQIKNKGKEIYEISRFCNKLNISVVGGFSKLLSFVEKTINPKEIITFIDERYGKGEYLNFFGFSFVSKHLSFQWTEGSTTCHRMRFPNNSGYENKMFKIWDCGQAKYTKKIG